MKKQSISFYTTFFVAALITPSIALAAQIEDVIEIISDILGSIVPIIFALALLFFLWGLAKFILSAGDESARKEGRNIMIWGIIALFIMVSVWGLVNLLVETFGVEDTSIPDLPEVPGSSGSGGSGGSFIFTL